MKKVSLLSAALVVLLSGCGSPAVTQSENIKVTEPVSNQMITSPVTIRGEARVFENTFAFRVRDADGTILKEDHAMANAPDVGQFGPFTVEASFAAPKGKTGTVEVFEYSAKDGSEVNMVRVPVRF